MKKRFICSVLAFTIAVFSFGTCIGEGQNMVETKDLLKSYSQENGYTYVTFGEYPQHIDGGEISPGQNWKWGRNVIKDTTGMTFQKSPILWRVLETDDEKAYLLSEYVLFASPIHFSREEYPAIGSDFSKTDLCRILNTDFMDTAFTKDQQDLLLSLENVGKVFLLTKDDIYNTSLGLGRGKPLMGMATEYSIRVTGSFVYGTSKGGHSPYWVMEQSTTDNRHGKCTKVDGSLGHLICDREDESARPCIYLDVTKAQISGGSGTKDDPYIIK